VEGRGVQICMARCRVADAVEPGAWKKFYAGGFTEPGLGGKDTPIVTSGQPQADALFPHVVFVPALRQFLMTFCLNVWSEAGNAKRSGIYVAFAEDGIHWPRDSVQQLWSVPVVARSGCEVAWHPTLILDGEESSRGWLYYGYSENWGSDPPRQPHYLKRRTIRIANQGS